MTASALVGVSVLAAATPVAAASTVTRVEAQITFTAASGDENDVSMTLAAGMYTITDAGAPITPGAGCSALDANTVTCASDGVTVIVAALGDRNDSLTNGTPTASVTYGGPGHDRLFGGSGPDELSGGDGEDELRGLQGADLLDGGRHADLLDGGDGADDVRGNRGRDTASYEGRLASVRASLDNKPNDGGFGEHDNVRRDVEHIIGGSGPDTLIGNAQPNDLFGLGGEDMLDGRGGADRMFGGPGGDQIMAAWDTAGDLMDGGHGDQDGVVYSRPTAIRVDPDGVADDGGSGEHDNVSPTIENIAGGSGDDVVIGSNGANSLNGGPGDDRLLGLGGADTLRGGPGRDRLIGGSGPDTLFGNHGIDTVDYSSRTVPISVDPDDIADDGAVDEHDNVRRSVENAVGGSAADQLTGNSEPNLLVGGAGGDTLTGHAGNDVLLGGSGFDLLTGNAGTDTCLVDEGGGSTSTCE